jgi:hypothetical protein
MSELAGADFPQIVIRNTADLANALRAVQNHLNLSNAVLEELAGITPGGVDKYIGPSRSKGMASSMLDLLLGALAIELVVRPDLAQAAKLAERWEARNGAQVRQATRIAKSVVDRARPIVLSEMGRRGAEARWQKWRAARGLPAAETLPAPASKPQASGAQHHRTNGHAAVIA